MSLKINFDHDWSCCRCATTDSDNVISLAVTSAVDNLDWFPVELPHIAAVARESIINNKFENWWSRKQFQLILSDQQLMQSVCLTFKSSGNDIKDTSDLITSPIAAVIWLKTVKIFSGSLRVPQISMELPQILLSSNQVENYNHKHTLIVCCTPKCLSFNAFLAVPRDAICNSIGEIQFNVVAGNTANLDERVNDVSDTVTDKVNDTSVPLLTIVMLIVGTRGDVQPFIA
jgi:hypothetical protein